MPKILYFDVYRKGKFLYQFKYKWHPIFPLDLNDVANELLKLRPSFKKYNDLLIEQTDQRL